MTYTVINHKDNITSKGHSLSSALALVSGIYDGAGIIAEILDSKGEKVLYSFTARGNAYTR